MDQDAGPATKTRTERFLCGGLTLDATLYLPAERRGRLPVVVMGNGFGAPRGFGLERTAEALAARGLAVLLFDYRHFGGSEGEPRQLVDVDAQLADFRAAIAHARTLPEVDAQRVGISGTSYGGGHALTVAAEDGGVAAVVAKVPHCDTRAAFAQTSMGEVARNMALAAKDALGARFGRPPLEIALVGEPGERAIMTHAGWRARYLGLVPAGARWHNGIPARSLLAIGEYRPVTSAPKVRCPVLVVYSKADQGIPASSVEATIAALRDVSVMAFEGDHFDVYDGPPSDEVRAREVAFFAEKLGA